MKTNIILKSADDLTVHPILENVPMMDDTSADWAALVLDISERGIDQPVIIDEQDRIMDGRHRWAAGQQAGVDIPCVVKPSAAAGDIVLHSLLNRRHYNKGAMAYVSYPVIAALVPQHGGNRKSKSTESTLKSADDLCDSLGFSRDLFFQAKQLHEAFANRPDLRAKFEGKILGGEIGLGACLAGIAGKESTERQPRKDRPAFELLGEAVEQMELRFAYWPKLEGSKRTQIVNRVVGSVLKWPDDIKEEIQSALSAANKGRK